MGGPHHGDVRKVTLALLLFLPLLSGCGNSLLLYPSQGGPNPPQATSTQIPVNGQTLQIWTRRANPALEPKAFVLEFCGNATRAEWIVGDSASRWRHLNAEVWAVNYPGFGASTGPARLDAIPPSALAAYDALRKRAADRPIYLAGTSLGTTAALYVAAHRPTAGLLLQNPPPLRELILEHYGWWNLWLAALPVALQVPGDLDSVWNAAHVTAPAVFVLADHDALVPPPFHRKVVDAFSGPKHVVILRDAGHNSSASNAEEAQIEADLLWLCRQPITASSN